MLHAQYLALTIFNLKLQVFARYSSDILYEYPWFRFNHILLLTLFVLTILPFLMSEKEPSLDPALKERLDLIMIR